MSQSGDVAETMTRMYLQGFEVGLRVTGAGAEKIMALILATMKDKRKTTGKTNLTNMLKSGKELKVFSVKQEDLRKFAEEAKRKQKPDSSIQICDWHYTEFEEVYT